MASHCAKETAESLNPNKLCNAILGRHPPTSFKNQSVLWTQPDVAGWLDKWEGPYISWAKRFFILQSSSLFYFRDNLNIESAQPHGVIPMEGSTLEVVDPKSGGAGGGHRKWCITLKLGPQFGARSVTHILSAPSKQALEEWVDKFTTASKTHVNLLAQLCKSRRMGSELHYKLSKTLGYAKMLRDAQGEEVEAIQTALKKVKQEFIIVHDKVVEAKAEYDKCEGEAMRALILWSLLSHHLEDNKSGNVLKILERLQVELDLTTELCQLLETKASFLEGQGIDKLNEDGRTALSLMCEKALNNVLHHQARIRVKAPRYTSDVNPLIFPEHDSQFRHTSEIYDLCLKFNKSAKKKVVDLKMKTIGNVKTITTSRAPPIEPTKVLPSKFVALKNMALKLGMMATSGLQTLNSRVQLLRASGKLVQ